MSESLSCAGALLMNVGAKPIGQVEGVFRGGNSSLTHLSSIRDSGSAAVTGFVFSVLSTPGAVFHGLGTALADLVTAPVTNVCQGFTEVQNSHYRPYAKAHEPIRFAELKTYASRDAEHMLRHKVLQWED